MAADMTLRELLEAAEKRYCPHTNIEWDNMKLANGKDLLRGCGLDYAAYELTDWGRQVLAGMRAREEVSK